VLKVVTGAPSSWLGGICTPSWPMINVTSEWAQFLNPYNLDTNQTVFQTLVESVGSQRPEWENDGGFVQNVIETILITMMTNGLARTAGSATIQGELKYCPNDDCDQICGLWCLDVMPKANQEFGYGGDIFNLSGVPDQSKLSKFTVEVEVNGYAYNIRGATMILSCIVLLFYCLLAGIHSVFVLVKRSSSTSWDTVSEVTALAMQSQPTQLLKNTCAGISTTRVFSHLVKVVETGAERDHLELDFGDRELGYGEPLVEDDFYG